MIYGYCRISRKQQSIDRQVRNIKAHYPDAIIIQEAYTGTTQQRPKWLQLRRRVQPGDTVVFDSVSRMSRDADEGFSTYEELYNLGVELIFLKEPMINTTTFRSALAKTIPPTGTNIDLILEGINAFLLELARDQIRLAFSQAEKEVQDLHQRTREGIETARLAGKRIGTPKGTKIKTKKSVVSKKIIMQHSKTFGGSLTDKECIKLAGITPNTFYKYKRELINTPTPADDPDQTTLF